MQSQVAELEGESSRLQSLLRQRDNEIERIGEVASKLSSERDNVSNVVRQEFADRYCHMLVYSCCKDLQQYS